MTAEKTENKNPAKKGNGDMDMPATRQEIETPYSDEEFDLDFDLDNVEDDDAFGRCVDDDGGIIPYLDGYDAEAFGDDCEEEFD